MRLGDRLRNARFRAGLSQEQLADRVGVTRLTIRNYELGRTSPSLDRLNELAFALRVPVSVLAPELAPTPSAA
jgi:transcriptional regulator with XRE-family HTH domain